MASPQAEAAKALMKAFRDAVLSTADATPPTLEQQRAGWQAILDNFARHVEAGR